METPRRSARIQKKTQISLENGRGFSLVQNTVYKHNPYFNSLLFLLESIIPIVSWALSLIIYSSMGLARYAKIIAILLFLFSIQYSYRNYSIDKSQSAQSAHNVSLAREINLKLEYLEEKMHNMTLLLNSIQNNSDRNILNLENELRQVSRDIKGEINTELKKLEISDKKEIMDLISKTCQKDFMINYALKSRGSIILDASSDYLESFNSKWLNMFFPGFRRRSRNKVISLLESKRNPGDCWAMKGNF